MASLRDRNARVSLSETTRETGFGIAYSSGPAHEQRPLRASCHTAGDARSIHPRPWRCLMTLLFQTQRAPQVPLPVVLYLFLRGLQSHALPHRLRLRRVGGSSGKAQVHLLWGCCGGGTRLLRHLFGDSIVIFVATAYVRFYLHTILITIRVRAFASSSAVSVD